MSLALMEAHEPLQQVIRLFDDRFASFLEKVMTEDTTIILFSDHGMHVNLFYYLYPFNKLKEENYSPALFIIQPRKLADKYRDVLKANEQKLLGGKDIYKTIVSMGNLEKGEEIDDAYDIVREIIPY